MKTLHTPGPWYQYTQGSQFEIKKGIYTIAMVHNYCTPNEAANEANARLITAAPEMFEALIGLIERHVELVMSGDCGHWDVENEEAVINARNAIAKAVGEKEVQP